MASLNTRHTGEPRKIAFVHVLKAGGTSLSQMLWRSEKSKLAIYPGPWDIAAESEGQRLAEMQRLYLMNPSLNPGLTAERRAQIRIACAHISFTMAKSFGPDFLYLSVLREPVSRVISHLRGLRREGGSTQSMSDIYHRQDTMPFRYLDNVQTRFFSSMATDVATVLHDFSPVTESSLTRARENVSALDIVGLTEYFADTVRLIEHASGRSLGPILHDNRRASDEAVPDVLRVAIEANNQFDVALYEFAAGLFRKQVRGCE